MSSTHGAAGEPVVEITTTSVGRDTLIRTYESFFEQVRFSGSYRVYVTMDPAYAVADEEMARVRQFALSLPDRYPQVTDVRVEQMSRHVGLSAALGVLFAMTSTPIGVHLEDDWEFFAPVDLDAVITDLIEQDSTEIVFGNTHAARDGTFERPDECVPVPGARTPLLRLTHGSWAGSYLPLCPHVHQRVRWQTAVAKALAGTDPVRCPDERVRELVVSEGSVARHNALWTREVVVRDLGRDWLSQRGQHRAIAPVHRSRVASPPLARRPDTPLRLTRSEQLRDRAERVTPGLTHTYYKRPENFAPGAYPMYLERGDGAVLWDVDGQSYIDFICSLGAATLGHNHPVVSNTIHERVGKGILLSLPTPAEVGAAELLTSQVPGADLVRFLKTGADACSAAVRLARSLTGREAILLAGFHGWHDQLMGHIRGVPGPVGALSRRVELGSARDDENFCADLERRGEQLAAVLLSTPYHRQLDAAFLREVRRLCDRSGTLLVFDEVVTGFRLAPGGLGQLRDVEADLLCFSKGIAAGMPVSAIAGPRRSMQAFGEERVSSTFAGDMLALEVMKAVLREYARGDYYERIALLGRRFRTGLNVMAREHGLDDIAFGYDPMPCLRFSADPAEHARHAEAFLAGMARRGVLLRRDVNFISGAHQPEHIDAALAAAGEVLANMRAKATR